MTRYHLDAYGALASVHTQMANFVHSSFPLADPTLDAALHDTIERFGLVAPPVVEATFPYEEPTKAPRTVQDLGERGVLHADLWSILDTVRGEAQWPRERSLYKHQVDAFDAYHAGKSLVVSSGTGSGKTECFLFPAIDTVLRDEALSTAGVRVLVVYPLNALVNNQMERLRALLGHHPHIRFGLYTSRLPERRRDAERRAKQSGRALFPAEVHSREELRAAPPHILITNYSMLEYALVRAADASIFSSAFAKPRLVVLDEAHVYAGAMAAEITLLLRRAWLRWGLDVAPQGIVTSATMQQGITDGDRRLIAFASELLSKSHKQVRLVTGRREKPNEVGSPVEVPLPDARRVAELDTDFPTLRDIPGSDGPQTVLEDGDAARRSALAIAAALNPGAGEALAATSPAACILWDAVHSLAWVRAVRRDLHGGVMRVDTLAQHLFPTAEPETGRRAAIRLLEILAVARRSVGEPPLLPVRLHGTVRGPHGIYACIRPTCDGAAVPGRVGRLHADPTDRCDCGAFVAELRACQACGQAFFAMCEDIGDDGFLTMRTQAHGVVNLFVAEGKTWDDGSPLQGGTVTRVLPSGKIGGGAEALGLRKFPGGVVSGPTRRLLNVACPKCQEKPGSDRPIIRRFEAGTTAVLQVLVDGLYPHLPQHRDASDTLRGAGRRALLFADNRQVAASLAAQVEESHDVIVARRLLLQALRGATETAALPPAVQAMQARFNAALRAGDTAAVQTIAAEMHAAASSAGPRTVGYGDLVHAIAGHGALRQLSAHQRDVVDSSLAAFVIARELGRRPSRLGNLEANGLATIDYALDLRRPKDPDVDAAFPGTIWRDLVAVVLDMLRTAGAIRLPALPKRLRELLPSWLTGRTVEEHVREGDDDLEEGDEDEERERKKVIPLVAAPGRGNRRSAWINRVCAALKTPPSVQPGLVLREIWGSLFDAAGVSGTSIERVAGATTDQMRITVEGLRFAVPGVGALFKCHRCKTIWSRHVAYVCPTAGCEGALAPIEGPSPRDRLVVLSNDTGPILGLRTHEHTAQIGVDELEVFERKFKAGEINLLVCSTTMELGVDIGGLSATILTNVPPSPSNYLQRAGRAGRRAEGTSLVLTYARPRPYDQASFEHPDRPFLDKITPPQVKLDSRRIVQRHANAVLLAAFFTRARASALEANPMAAFGEVDTFADQPIEKALCAQPTVVAELKAQLAIDPSQSTLADAFIAWVTDIAANDEVTASAIEKVVRGTALQQEGVASIAGTSAHRMASILEGVREQLRSLRSQLEEELATEGRQRDGARMKAIEIAVADLAKEKLLTYLAEQQFLPRYGFPINVCRLHESWEERDRDDNGLAAEKNDDRHLGLRLERDVTVALSEYAPGAEVIAGKYVYASRGLVRHWTGTDAPGSLPMHAVGICGSCGRLLEGRNEGDIATTCPTCGEEGVRTFPVVRPTGFAVKWGREPRRWIGGARPPAKPVTDAAYAARDDVSVRVSDDLALAYDEQGTILVRSEGDLAESDPSGDDRADGGTRVGRGYAICYVCGRAEPERHARQRRPVPLPPELVDHERLRGEKPCTPTNRYWRHVALAGAVRTETLRFVVEPLAALGTSRRGRSLATTLMVAMQLAAGEVLGVDSREISSLLSPREADAGAVFDVVLYDARAGGSGHCRALLDRWTELLEAVRGRLACSNLRCTRACPKCLIAFETQRHIDLLDRPALGVLLEDRWESLQRRIVRDGVPVARLHRGGIELGEAISRAEDGASVTVVVARVAADSLAETGWLRKLMRTTAPGSLRLVAGRAPDPDDDGDRFLAERLRLAIEGGEIEMRIARPDSIAALPWRVSIGAASAATVYHLDGAEDEALGPHWLDGAAIHRATADIASMSMAKRVDALTLSAKVLEASQLRAAAPPPTMVIHNVPKNLHGESATFRRWFRGPNGKSLFDKPMRSLTITDPYLGTKWQIGLLRELVELVKVSGCAAFTVFTYPPKLDDYSSVAPADQAERIARIIGNPGWKPLPLPQNRVDRIHKRVVKGERVDGTKFEVFLERGLDFIVENSFRGRPERATRESYLVVRDPA